MNDEIESMRKCNKCKSSFTLVNFNMNNQGEYTKTIRGSSYIPTPAKFSSPKCGLVNIRNTDNKCFKWCLTYHQSEQTQHSDKLSYLDKVQDKYNYEGVNFPTSYGDIERFQENNKVCVVVFTTKKEDEDTIIVKEFVGNPEYVVNETIYLLRVEDEEEYEDEDDVSSSHYIYILKIYQNYSNYGILEKTLQSIAIIVIHVLNVTIYVNMLKNVIRINIEMVL